MSTKTTNYDLTKPAANDYYDIDIHNANMDIIDGQLKAVNDKTDGKLGSSGNGKDVTVTFADSSTRANIVTGEKLSVMLSKIKKFFADLTTLAFGFCGSTANQALFTTTAGAVTAGQLPIAAGGTNASTADAARANIGAAKCLNKTATLAVANWTGTAAPYTYELADADILANDTPFVDRVTGTDATAAAAINTAWALIAGYAVKPQTSPGKITFKASAKPSVSIPIMYEVVRQ